MQAKFRKLTMAFLDVFFISLALYMAFLTRHGTLPSHSLYEWFSIWSCLVVISLSCNLLFNLYRSLWQYAGINELLYILCAGTLTCSLYFAAIHLLHIHIAYSIYFLIWVFDIVFLGISRIGFRIIRSLLKKSSGSPEKSYKKVLVVGAGEAGAMVIKELRGHDELGLRPIALIDDDRYKQGTLIQGIKVYGDHSRIGDVVRQLGIDEIIIAMPSVPREAQADILDECKKTKCRLKTLPGVYELISGNVSIQQIRDVEIEDLLGRDPIDLNVENICGYIQGKVVLVTGGGGSIGSELCRQIARFDPKQLLILDIYENNAYDLEQELKWDFPELNYKVIIGSVRDKARMEWIFHTYRPDVVFHAAAHKHVPLMENNPAEAIKNNVFGTWNVAECADRYGTGRFVMISTDKAVNPTNIMGATKRIAEMIIQGMDRISRTEYVAVRFGNVLGSNGSVIPLFKKQIAAGGPVTVTHPDINRFFMTIPEAVQLVLEAGSMAQGGEIFILDMGKPMKIADLARDLIRLSGLEPGVDIKIQYTGLRPGEKLYEELLMKEEGLTATRHKKIFVGKPGTIDIGTLKGELEKLKFVMSGPADALKEYVKEMVPTYHTAVPASVHTPVLSAVDEVATGKEEYPK